MTDKNWNTADETEFEAMLSESLDTLPPADVTEGVTPWRKAMSQVLWGCALTSLTFNFLLLNYILPAIGTMLMFLGFRTLRRENRWFKLCFLSSAVRVALTMSLLTLNATIYCSRVYQSIFSSWLEILMLFLNMSLFFCLWRGLKAVKSKTVCEIGTGSAAALIVWYLIIVALAIAGYQGLIIGGIVIICYIFIIRSLFKLSKALDEAGYGIDAAPVTLSDLNVSAISASVTAALMLCGYLFFCKYTMDWQPVKSGMTEKAETIKAELLTLGFPENILSDLSEEEILSMENPIEVAVDVMDHPMNEGREVREVSPNGDGRTISISTVYDVKELRVTGIAVRLSGERENWKIIQHFEWVVTPDFSGTESVRIIPASHLDEWDLNSGFSGRLLYDKEDETYTAPYVSLGEERYTSNSIFWGEQAQQDVFAAFSMPNDGENHRGYVCYTIESNRPEAVTIIDSWFFYAHQQNLLQYPVMTATERQKISFYMGRDCFVTADDALQLYPYEEKADILN